MDEGMEALMTNAILERTTFATSRLMEFFTEKELSMQIGHDRAWWPAALLKELVDNALDACEMAGTPPHIDVALGDDVLSVQDNGPGIPSATIERSLDYLIRVSDKTNYASPTRGQLGNALKCLWAAAYVATEAEGHVRIETRGLSHDVTVTLDRIAQQPALTYQVTDGVVRNGTLVTIHWPGIAGCLEEGEACVVSIERLLAGYAAFNPHASFTWSVGARSGTFPRTAPDFRKWRPGDPTSAHWYTSETLRSLIAAYVAQERQDGARARTVREFVSEFHGLSGTAKQKVVTGSAGLAGAYLHDLVTDGDVASDTVEALLRALKEQSRAPKPRALGVLGKERLSAHMVSYGHVGAESVRYKKVEGTAGGLPFVLEAAFGLYTEDYPGWCEVTTGLNWTPALKSPIRELMALLGQQRLDYTDPVALLVHLTCPVLQFADRGKGALDLQPEIRAALEVAVQSISKEWKAAKRRADKKNRVLRRDLERMRSHARRQEWSIKEAAYEVMQQAYLAASANGTLPANARQIMYAARPLVLDLTGGTCWKDSAYFTQHLLPDYMDEHSAKTAEWNVIFDARGHFLEPHTKRRTDLGTLEVRQYMGSFHTGNDEALGLDRLMPETLFPTCGPANRYRFALFVEKEGFNPLLAAARIAERFDLAVMSTKGMSVTAARALVEELSDQGVTVLVLHDFDKAGFSIVHTLATSSRRYTFDTVPNVLDLGLRLADVQDMGLASEPVYYRGRQDPRWNLRENGASEAECDYLVRAQDYGGYHGERVELNAMTAAQFVDFLETKLEAAGVTKVVPEAEVLERAYRRARHMAAVRRAAKEALTQAQAETIKPPPDLAEEVARRISGAATSWDEAIWDIVSGRETAS